MAPIKNESADVIVIGGGPAGATVAALVAQKGHRVVIYEREHFPRFHIGESLIPCTYHPLERLGMLPKLKASHFVRKHSVQFITQHGKLSEPFYFEDHRPHESSYTWQVYRQEFDVMMLDNAREHGVTVHEGARVLDVIFDGDRAVGVEVLLEDGTRQESRAKVIVDATGQHSMIMRKLNLRDWDPVLKKSAIWTYYEGAFRDSGKDEGATIIMQTKDKAGWFWYIPLQNNLTSVGVVAGHEYLFKNRASNDLGAIFAEEVERCPGVQPRIAGGKRTTQYFSAREYSYKARQTAGAGWTLVGDAYGFLDPLYSSGVLLALQSGQLAADAITDGMARNDTSAAQLGRWNADFNRGMDRMRRLVIAFYEGLSFGAFLKKHPHLKGCITDLLIGDLFDDKVDVLWEPLEAFRKEQAAMAMV